MWAEVGRRPLAGNVVTAAVGLPEPYLVFIRTERQQEAAEKKRLYLARLIIRHAVSYGVSTIPYEIDQLNILKRPLLPCGGQCKKPCNVSVARPI